MTDRPNKRRYTIPKEWPKKSNSTIITKPLEQTRSERRERTWAAMGEGGD